VTLNERKVALLYDRFTTASHIRPKRIPGLLNWCASTLNTHVLLHPVCTLR